MGSKCYLCGFCLLCFFFDFVSKSWVFSSVNRPKVIQIMILRGWEYEKMIGHTVFRHIHQYTSIYDHKSPAHKSLGGGPFFGFGCFLFELFDSFSLVFF